MPGGGEGFGDDEQELGGLHGATTCQYQLQLLGEFALPVSHLLQLPEVLTQQLHMLVGGR